ncbi:MAG: hypothetical protein J6T98_01715, partial [Salinivirgaceae bacterium]|nr:hypothetical protein [Salinivirgaceae bacterium]
MNKLAIYGAMLVGLMASCTQNSKTFTINGTVDSEIADSIYLVYIGNEDYINDTKGVPNDTIVVKDKAFNYS